MNYTAEQLALLDGLVCLGKRQILTDVRVGHVPREVPEFAALHDYRDANMYGMVDGEFDPDASRWFSVDLGNGDQDNTALFEFYNEVQERLDAWAKTGVLLTVPLDPGALDTLQREAEERARDNARYAYLGK